MKAILINVAWGIGIFVLAGVAIGHVAQTYIERTTAIFKPHECVMFNHNEKWDTNVWYINDVDEHLNRYRIDMMPFAQLLPSIYEVRYASFPFAIIHRNFRKVPCEPMPNPYVHP